MLYGVKLSKEELFMAKKKGLVFLHFIWSKNLKEFPNGNFCLLTREGEGDILADKFS